MTYMDFVLQKLKEFAAGKPIYTCVFSEDLEKEYGLPQKKAAAALSVTLKRIMDGGIDPFLRFYRKGIYYRTAVTPFGELGIDKEALIADKYLIRAGGYETGPSVLHKLGLSSQMPKGRFFVTNRVSGGARLDEKLGVIVRPPRAKINAENKAYFQFLDILDLMDKAPIDAESPYAILSEYIKKNNLLYGRLLFLANRYYNQKTVLQLARAAGEGGWQ